MPRQAREQLSIVCWCFAKHDLNLLIYAPFTKLGFRQSFKPTLTIVSFVADLLRHFPGFYFPVQTRFDVEPDVSMVSFLHWSDNATSVLWLLRAPGCDCSGCESVNRSRVLWADCVVHRGTPWYHPATRPSPALMETPSYVALQSIMVVTNTLMTDTVQLSSEH